MQSDLYSRRHLTMFAKAPVAGQVKTRLTPALTYEQAAALHGAFILDLGMTLERFGAQDDTFTASLSRAGDVAHPIFVKLLSSGVLGVREQGGGGLGDRLVQVCEEAFAHGVEQLVIIGSDSPTLDERHIGAAFSALEDGADVVLGPSFDGGYYLIGLSAPHVGVFDEISWSSRQVLEETLKRCGELELKVRLLEFWYDVDDVQDLLLMRGHLVEHLARVTGEKYSETRKMIEELDLGSF